VFYLAAFALVIRGADLSGPVGLPARHVTVGWALAGVAVSAVLTWIELFVIRSVCGWCMLSAAASILLLIGTVTGRPTDEAGSSRTARTRRRANAQLAT